MKKSVSVLIVEDRPDDVELMMHELIHSGFVLNYQVVDTEIGFSQHLLSSPDIILTDYNLPSFNARRALEILKERDLDIPVIIVTGSVGDEIAVDCIKMGAADYLLKDRLARLGTAVTQSLEQKKLRNERLHAEEALRESNERLAALVQASPLPIIAIDLEGCVQAWNQASSGFFGWSQDEVIGELLPIIDKLHWNEFKENINLFISNVPPKDFEINAVLKNGDPVIISMNMALTHDVHQNVTGIFLLILDIIERKKREKEREAIAEVAYALRTASSLAEILPIVLDQVTRLVNCPDSAIGLVQNSQGDLFVQLARGDWAALEGQTLPKGEDGIREVLATGKAFTFNDLESSRYEGIFKQKNITAITCLPLIAQEKMIGLLCVGQHQTHTDRDLVILSSVADMSANALHRAALLDEAERRLKQLQALRAIDTAITASLDLNLTLNILLGQLTVSQYLDGADVLLVNPHSHQLEYKAGRGFQKIAGRKVSLRLGEGLAGTAAKEHRSITVPDLRTLVVRETGRLRHRLKPFTSSELAQQSEIKELLSEGFIGYTAVPLIAKGVPVGVLETFHRTPLAEEPEWNDFLEALAAQAALAIDTARLFESLQKANTELVLAYDASIEALSKAVDLRGKHPENHSLDLADLALLLAQTLGVAPNALIALRQGALLHDIGILGIPDLILLKPGPLTESEWAIMQRHPVVGYKMLSTIDFLKPALEIVYNHHERWDGSGYPKGLKGEQIPLSARICSVVDVWCALRKDQPYRSAWSSHKACQYIKDQSAILFDPRVVTVFLKLVEERNL